MQVICVYCASEGKPALMSDKAPLDDPRVTHRICVTHQRRLARTAKKSSEESIINSPLRRLVALSPVIAFAGEVGGLAAA